MLITKSEAKALFRVGLPAVLAQVANMSMGVIDTLMAGRIDANALASIAVGTNLINPLLIFVLGVFLALNPIVAQLNGAKRHAQIGVVARQGLIIALLFAIPSVVILFNASPLLSWLEIQPSLTNGIVGYLEACSWGIPGLYLFFALRFVNEGLFATKTILLVNLAAIPFNVSLNYWFIWGGLGVPAMGVVGIGYATAIVWMLMFCMLIGYSVYNSQFAKLQLWDRHWIDWQQTREIFRIGMPMGITVVMEITMFALFGLLIGKYAVEMVAAHQIAINVASLAYMVPLGLSIGITARVGFYIGEGRNHGARLASSTGMIVALTIALLSSLVIALAAPLIVPLYTEDQAVSILAITLLIYAALFQFSDALQAAAMGALRGLKDTRIPLYISVIAYWLVGFPFGYYMAEIVDLKAEGYWMGFILALSVAGSMLLWRLIWQIKRLAVYSKPN